MIKYLFPILLTIATAYPQTIKTLGYNTTNETVVYSNNNLTFTNNVNFSSLSSSYANVTTFVGNSISASASINAPFIESSDGDNALQIHPTGIVFIGESGASNTRNKLGLGISNNVSFKRLDLKQTASSGIYTLSLGQTNTGFRGVGGGPSDFIYAREGVNIFQLTGSRPSFPVGAAMQGELDFYNDSGSGINSYIAFSGPSAETARTTSRANLGLGTMATESTNSYAKLSGAAFTGDVTISGRVGIGGGLAVNTNNKLLIQNGNIVFTAGYGLAFGDGTTQTSAGLSGTVAITNGGTGAASAEGARTNLALGETNNVVFASVNAGSLGTGIRQSGLDGILRFDAATLERARLTPQYQFILLGSNGNLNFGPDNTNGAAITRTNLGITQDIMTFYAARDATDAYIVSSVTGGASITGSYGDSNIAVTNPIGRGLPFYRLAIPNVSPRTNSDLAAIRSAFSSQPYFAGPTRTKIEWSENKHVYMRIAAPIVGGGTFQFTFGESATPTFVTNVNAGLPFPSETFIGFSLTRTNSPAQWTPRIISRMSSSAPIVTNSGLNTSTNDLLNVTRLLLEFMAGSNSVINLYSLNSSGVRTLWVSQTNTGFFTNATNAHQVNWIMGISPTPPNSTNSVGQMQYDVEPPVILQ